MLTKPLVSIVIPTFNQVERFLRECIESAIAQTYDSIEIVISDNHSTNNSASVIKEYATDRESKIRVVKPPEFLNLSGSLLYVFSQAKGDYICYISSDDILLPECVAKLVEKMEEHEDVVFSHGEALYFDKDVKPFTNWRYFNEISGVYDINEDAAQRLMDFSYVCFAGCIIRASVWRNIAILFENKDIIIKNYIDLLIVFMLFEEGKVYFLNEVLAKVRLENESRNKIVSYTISDAVFIWDYIASEKKLSEKLSSLSLDITYYKRKHFNYFNQTMVNEYVNGSLSASEFKEAIDKLKTFRLSFPVRNKAFYSFVRFFPGFSIILYRNIVRLFRIFKLR
jgi:glycosyltransferase involved in cell wall biosynthesis